MMKRMSDTLELGYWIAVAGLTGSLNSNSSLQYFAFIGFIYKQLPFSLFLNSHKAKPPFMME